MTLTVPCLFGLESLVADEMKRLQLQNVRAENGRVHCEGSMADIARLNINLRCGARVLMELGSFPAKDFEALFQGVLALPWEDFIPRDGEFPVKGYSLNSTLHSVPACQAIVKKASAKRLGNAYGCETLPETGSRYQIQFAIIKDQATLYLDTSGEGLYKRGYRARNMGAPLRETLAAALVTLSRYRGKDPFCDPFCGSGTIPIEAALIAKNRAPGLDRSFAAQKWKNMDSKLWLDAADEAMDKEFHGTYDIWGGDIDPAAVELARPVRGSGCGQVPPGQRVRPIGDQPALRRAAAGEERGRGAVPGVRPGRPDPAPQVAGAGALLPHGVRALLRPPRRQEAEALQRHVKM